MVGEPAVRTIRMRDDVIEGRAGRDGATSAVAAGCTVHLARMAGDPDNSLKEAGEILGKARTTIYLWYRNGGFPPA